MQTKIGLLIRRTLRDNGITTEMLAKRIGCPPQQLRWASAGVKTPYKGVIEICRYFGVDRFDFFDAGGFAWKVDD